MNDRDKPKRSWREIDSNRDGSRQRNASPARPESANGADAKASRAHRAALDALFEKGEIGKYAEKLGLGSGPQGKPVATSEPAKAAPPPDPEAEARAEKDAERSALRKKLMEATSRDAIGRAFDRYAKTYGVPKDWELLEKGLEHPSDEKLGEVLGELEALLGREKPRRARTLDGRLRFIAETHEDRELRDRAAAIRARL